MIWQVLSGLFFLTTIIFGYTTYNLYNKVTFYQQWYDNLASTVEEIYNQLQRLDQSGAYESNDEVGVFFSALKQMMKELFKLGFYDEGEVEESFPTKG
jgi:hypothetical protein